jgi:hypothetical protein
MFQSPGGFRHVDIRYTGPFGEPDRAVYGPAMDGSSVYLPALVAEHPEAYGVTSYSGDLEPSSIDLPGPGLTPYHHCICQDCLLLPSGDGVAVFRPYKSHAALEAQQAFRGGVPIVAAGRPIMDPAKEHLYMPVPDGISCFQFL